MLKISKLADYGTAIMVFLTRHATEAYSAKDIAANTHIALPTVSKLLKRLARGGLLESQRGAKGGYALAQPPEKISVAKIISVLEGDIAITQCSDLTDHCSLEAACATRHHWQMINRIILKSLNEISLAAMSQPALQLSVPTKAAGAVNSISNK